MNIRDPVEVENKKNKNSLSVSCYPVNRLCLSRKIQTEKENKDERKEEEKKYR